MEELTEFPQWVLWKAKKMITNENKEKLTKVPIGKNGRATSITNPTCFKPFEQAVEEWTNLGIADGIGFCLTESDPFTCIDLDKISTWNGWEEIIEKFKGTYMEVSPSKTGLHIWCKAKLELSATEKQKVGKIEVYDKKRYMTVTIDPIPSKNATTEIINKQNEVKWLVGTLQDTRFISIILSDRNINICDKMQRLFAGDITGYASHSEADLAFCRVLANKGAPMHQIDRIFRKTKLMRTKWDEKRGEETYGKTTLKMALNGINKNF